MKKEATDVRAGLLLHRTRQQAMLSQAEVATRAGVPQSTVSAYESSSRQPTLPMLSKLLEAMGAELILTAAPAPERLAPLSGPTGLRVRRHRGLIVMAAERHGAENVRVLGAVARGEERDREPLELLVDQAPAATAMSSLTLAADLEEIVGVKVKLLSGENVSRDRRAKAEGDGIAL